MITLEKLKIYSRYRGDVDIWIRTGKSKEKKIMVSNDWYLIDSLIQDIGFVKKGLSSEQFSFNLKKRLLENCESEEAIKELKSFSS